MISPWYCSWLLIDVLRRNEGHSMLSKKLSELVARLSMDTLIFSPFTFTFNVPCFTFLVAFFFIGLTCSGSVPPAWP